MPRGDIVTKVRPRGGYDSGDELTSARGVDQCTMEKNEGL